MEAEDISRVAAVAEGTKRKAEMKLSDLSIDILDKVIRCMRVRDLPPVACCSTTFREVIQQRLEKTGEADLSDVSVNPNPDPQTLSACLNTAFTLLPGLVTLKIPYSQLRDEMFDPFSCLDKLTCLDINSCEGVTDYGLKAVARACPKLRNIDLTYCNGTTYDGVRSIREGCPDIEIIRRQPVWLDGRFECPWGEVHVYYCDGSFEFSREAESVGWVCFLKSHGEYVEDKLQYTNLQPWIPPIYRPGVLLKQIPQEPDQEVFIPMPPSLLQC